MKKLRPLLMVVPMLLLLTGACATQAVIGAGRTPLDQAELNYTAAGLDYEALMLSAQQLEADGLLPAGARSILVTAQTNVQKYYPIVRAGLDLWRDSGTKPESVGTGMSKLLAAIADVRKVVNDAEAKRPKPTSTNGAAAQMIGAETFHDLFGIGEKR